MECPSCHKPTDGTERFCKHCGSPVPTASAEGADPLLGQVLGGKFRVIKLLGEGGMGAVYEGEQQLGTKARKVAIKTLHAHLSTDPKIQARFQRECGTIAELEHPNTIQVYDFGTTKDGQLYIVMEYVQGRSLADVLEKDGPMDPGRVDAVMRQIAGSLEEAHARGIVHRDLKPDNVVLTDRAGQKEFVKVLDFGIAKRGGEEDKNEQKLTQQGMVLGTPPYMSPEQFTGNLVDARSDIYALGVMGYEMLTGKLPWTAETPWEWATQHMTVQPYPVEQLPEGLRAPEPMRMTIMRAMAKKPDERFATVKEFYESFSLGGKVAGQTAQQPRVTIQSSPGEPVSMRGATQATAVMAPSALMQSQQQQPMQQAPMQQAPMQQPPMQQAPMQQPPMPPMQHGGPPGGRPPVLAAAASGGGGGGGKMIAIGLIAVFVLGGGGVGAYLMFANKAPTSDATDGGIAATTADAGASGSDDVDASIAPLTTLDAGKDSGRVIFDAGFRPIVDAGKAAPTASTAAGTCHWIPACKQTATLRAAGQKTQADKLANDCRNAGCVPE